jgi:hypothetical protein
VAEEIVLNDGKEKCCVNFNKRFNMEILNVYGKDS